MINEQDIKAFQDMNDLMDSWGYWTPDEITLMAQPNTVQEMVTEYHNTAGLDSGVKFIEAPLELCNLRWDLITEEYTELMEEAGSVEGILKEMADLVYVLYGAAVTFGWDLDEAVRRVHNNNMKRMYQPDGKIHRREDGKILRNKDIPPPKLDDLV